MRNRREGGRTMTKALKLISALVATLFLAAPAQAAPADPLAARAGELVGLVNAEADPATMFTPHFLSEIPAAELQRLMAAARGQYGRALAVAGIERSAPNRGVVRLRLERATLRMQLALEPAPPHRIEGLLIEAADQHEDSFPALLEEFRKLPGSASFALARLGEGKPEMLHQMEGDAPLAIGSEFKLWILAELAREIAAGERRWSDVVALDRRSHPSGILQSWPEGAPMTLHSLATLMISVSDNTASDVVLHALGREKVEALLPALGVADPGRTRPLLSTWEASAIKRTSDTALAEAWAAADEKGRRALLARAAGTRAEAVDLHLHGTAPRMIGEVEWFASAADMVRTMDWLRRSGGEEALEILAVNPGLGPAAAERFGYLGFKGGSEPGVVAMTFLLRAKSGGWMAVSGKWNDPKAPLDEMRFQALMNRAIGLAAAM